ncbi:hypothetical protein [Streptomyces sp. NBC_00151]|uniref:hypothetical protein n=1 Tax=Streptomyces sp. NBC_00151 TaxID=2975669 RepID=UPI002DDB600A|nr:hypothetical protein [Streptomyces sp. NBC_00151]WRZ44572.1 hypothetical protein OG915_45210 [Streptomyces sp. NBC_00151]
MGTDDWELVQRYCAGDNEAARQLLKQYEQQLIKVALPKLGGNWHDAQEAVGDAFVALANYRKDEPIRSVGSWLRSVTLKKAVDKVRRKEPASAGEPEESLPDLHGGVEQVDMRLAVRRFLQALDVQERRVLAVALEGKTVGWPNLHRAQALNMELYRDYYPAFDQARLQALDALLLLHMLHSENRPCRGLLKACGVIPGQESKGPQLTPAGRKAGMDHIETCEKCSKRRDEVKRHRWNWVPGVLFTPSPELHDRVRNICDARRMENKPGNEREQRNPGSEAQSTHTDIRRTTTRPGTQPARWDASPMGTRSVRRRRPKGRATKAIGAGVLAALLAIAIIDKSGAAISLPELGTLPGVEASTGPSGHANGGSKDGGSKDGGSKDGGSKDGGNKDGGSKDGGSKDGGSKDGGNKDGGNKDGGSKDGGNKDGGSKDGGSKDGGNKDGGNKDGGSKDGGSNDGGSNDGGNNPPEDTTGPSVSLTGISTNSVGQEVVGTGGSIMQTCGPAGTPTTYSVWVAASDPSGIYRVMLHIQHPTDGMYKSSAGVADGNAIRFDIPAYRTGPKPQDTVQLQLSVTAKDMNGNLTDAGLGTLPLYECGEPG